MKDFIYGIIITTLIIMLIFSECGRSPEIITETETITEIIPGDTIKQIIEVPSDELVPDTVYEIEYIDVPIPTDTQEIIDKYIEIYRNYHATREYSNIMLDDSTAFIKVYNTINKNKLKDQKLEYKNRRPTKIKKDITNIIKTPEHQIFLGLNYGRAIEYDIISLDLDYVINQKNKINIQYGTIFNEDKNYFGIGYSRRILDF